MYMSLILDFVYRLIGAYTRSYPEDSTVNGGAQLRPAHAQLPSLIIPCNSNTVSTRGCAITSIVAPLCLSIWSSQLQHGSTHEETCCMKLWHECTTMYACDCTSRITCLSNNTSSQRTLTSSSSTNVKRMYHGWICTQVINTLYIQLDITKSFPIDGNDRSGPWVRGHDSTRHAFMRQKLMDSTYIYSKSMVNKKVDDTNNVETEKEYQWRRIGSSNFIVRDIESTR